jgi:hypothetical protein
MYSELTRSETMKLLSTESFSSNQHPDISRLICGGCELTNTSPDCPRWIPASSVTERDLKGAIDYLRLKRQ